MTPDLTAARLRGQQIAASRLKAVADVVQWMGAMQAQDFPMVKWAVGIRMPACTDQAVEQALARGEIIRTHLLRPTWHLVSAADARWLLELTGPRIKAGLGSRHRQLELTPDTLKKSRRVIDKLLRGGGHVERPQIVAALNKAGIRTDENRASHLLLLAELDCVACSGAMVRGKPTYASLDSRVPAGGRLAREEALGMLARRYFRSRGPATLPDFTWWSGLAAKEAARAIDSLGDELSCERIDSRAYWMSADAPAPSKAAARLHLIPAYDEYTISYRDRSDVLPTGTSARAISINGIFYPLVILDGKAVGTWKRRSEDGRVLLNAELFEPLSGRAARQELDTLLQKAGRRYGRFLETDVEVIWTAP